MLTKPPIPYEGAFSVIVKTGGGTDGSFYSTNFCTNVLLANAGMGMEEYGGVGSGHVITITKQIIGNCGQFMVWPLDQ